MAYSKLRTTTTTTDGGGGGSAAKTTIADVHHDVLQKHIFTRLDGPALASASCASSQFHSLSAEENLWSHICAATWPSTNTRRLRHVISSFPNGPRSFFSDSFPLLAATKSVNISPPTAYRPPEIISAVDIHHRGDLVFSKVVETETVSGWFRNSPFRVDLLDPKDVVATAMEYPASEEMCSELSNEITLSWIVVDAAGRRAVNVSSRSPVSVRRHWLNGEVQAKFAAVVGGGERGTAAETVLCEIAVTCGAEMQVKEVSLQVEDMDGKHLNGKDSLGILQRCLEGKKGKKINESKKRYEEYLERKRERKERKMRAEGRLDTLCVGFAVFMFSLFWFLLLCRL